MAKEKETFEQYRPATPDDLTSRQLRVGEWWLKRRRRFRYTIVTILLLIGVGGIGYGLFTVGYYFIVGQDQEVMQTKQLLRQKVPFANYHESLAPTDPSFEKVQVLKGTDDLYDFITFAINPNSDWYVEIEYRFIFDTRETETKKIMLSPGQETVVANLGYETTRKPSNPIIEVTNVQWFRVSAHLTRTPDAYVEDRTRLTVRNAQLIVGTEDETAEGIIGAHRALFTMHNETAFNYWSVPVYVMFNNGSSLRAIERTELKELRSGEQRELDVRLLQPGLNVNNIEVYTYIPVFDDSIYMPQ